MKLTGLLGLAAVLANASGFPSGTNKVEALPLRRHSRKFLDGAGKPEAFRKACGQAALRMLNSF